MRSLTRLGMGAAASALSAVVLLGAGCGSSSKPAYCSKTSDLKTAVNKLTDDATSANFSALQSDLSTIETDAKAVVSSAKADFPSQTSAIDSSVSSLKTAVDQLPANPSAQQLLQLVPKVSSAVSAVDSFESATSSSCK